MLDFCLQSVRTSEEGITGVTLTGMKKAGIDRAAGVYAPKFITAARDVLALIETDGFDMVAGFEPREGHIYTVTRAISARINQNFDGFPSSELKAAYKTFLGKPCFVNHHNEDPLRARGRVVGARYVEEGADKYIQVIQEANARKYPVLAKEIIEGGIDAVSMGCVAASTICSFCGNEATDMFDMCDHVLRFKGQILSRRNDVTGAYEDIQVYEECRKLGFFELSWVFDPADETALHSKVISASAQAPAQPRIACDLPGCKELLVTGSTWEHTVGEEAVYDFCTASHRSTFEAINPNWRHANLSKKSFGEVEAPEKVDTLRDEEDETEYHQYVQSPPELSDPDLKKNKEVKHVDEKDDRDETDESDKKKESAMNRTARRSARGRVFPGLRTADVNSNFDQYKGEGKWDELSQHLQGLDLGDLAAGPQHVRDFGLSRGWGQDVTDTFLEVGGWNDPSLSHLWASKRTAGVTWYTVNDNILGNGFSTWNLDGTPPAGPQGQVVIQLDGKISWYVEDAYSNFTYAQGYATSTDDAKQAAETALKATTAGLVASMPKKRKADMWDDLLGVGWENNNKYPQVRQPSHDNWSFPSQDGGVYTGPGGSGSFNGVGPERWEWSANGQSGVGRTNYDAMMAVEDALNHYAKKARTAGAGWSWSDEHNRYLGGDFNSVWGQVYQRNGWEFSVYDSRNAREEILGSNSGYASAEEAMAVAGALIDDPDSAGPQVVFIGNTEKKTSPSRAVNRTGSVQEHVNRQNTGGNAMGRTRTRVADQSRNDQGVAEDAFITQTPPAEPVETAQGEEVHNTENNLVAHRRTYARFCAFVAGQVGGDVKTASVNELRKWARRYAALADIKIAELYPTLGVQLNAARKLAADDDDEGPSGDKADDKAKDDAKDAGNDDDKSDDKKEAIRRAALKRRSDRTASDDDKPAFLKGDDDDKSDDDEKKDDKDKKESKRRAVPRSRRADTNLEVADPDGRIDVERPTADTTDDEAQASQFDKHDFGDNAGDDIADPDLSTDQNWAPGDGKKSSSKAIMASSAQAVRLAECYIRAGIATEDQKWALVDQFAATTRAVVRDRTALLDRVNDAAPRAKTAGFTRGSSVRSAVPQNLTAMAAQPRQVTSALDDSDPANDSLLFG